MHPHSLTPKATVKESRPLRFPQIPPFSADRQLLFTAQFPSPPTIAEANNLLRQEVSKSSSRRRRMHLEPCSYPLFSVFPRFKVLSSLSTTPSGCRFPKRSHHRDWLEFVDFLSSERRRTTLNSHIMGYWRCNLNIERASNLPRFERRRGVA